MTTASSGSKPEHGRVLIVDDEDAIRRVASRMLARAGYEVVACASGRDALSTMERPGPAFDLVVLDMVLPDMNGRDVFKSLRDRQPGLPVLFMSGYSADDLDVSGDRHMGFVAKPFDPVSLTSAVRALMAVPGP